MLLRQSALTTVIVFLLFASCAESPKKDKDKVEENITNTDTVPKVTIDATKIEEEEEEAFKLTEENAIDFFFDYSKKLKKDKLFVL